LIELALVNRLRLTGKSKPDEAQPVNNYWKRKGQKLKSLSRGPTF